MDVTDYRTYPDYLARDLADFITVATTDTGPDDMAVLLEIAVNDTFADGCLPVGLGFDLPADAHWPPRGGLS